MSLELALKENTAAIHQLIAAMQNGKTFTPDDPPPPKTDHASVKKEPKSAVEATPEATFDKAKTLILKLTTGGYRSEALGILNKFGAQRLGQVPQEKLADVVMLAEAALQGEG